MRPGALDFVLDATDADLAALLGGDAFTEDTDLGALLVPGTAVQEVASRIAGQYAEVLAAYIEQLFRQRRAEGLATDTVSQLRRLAEGVGNLDQVRMLDELIEASGQVFSAPTRHSRQLALNRLRSWIPDFAGTLDPTDGERLLAVVSWEAGSLPLLDELRNIHGIGPKRLARLYSAGLYSVGVVASAQPSEVAEVTGLSEALATEVVRAAQQFADTERQRCATEVRDRARRLKRVLVGVDIAIDPAILAMARSALTELQELVAGLEEES